jgi:hypothetical protein
MPTWFFGIIAVFLSFPLLIGVWLAGVKLYKLSATYTNKETAFVIALCAIAGVLTLTTAPYWLLGWKGYAVVAAIYIAFVAYGAPHVYRVLRFLALELDGDPNDQVPLPGDEPTGNTKKS